MAAHSDVQEFEVYDDDGTPRVRLDLAGCSLAECVEKYRVMYERYRPHLGPSQYCKYCHRDVRPLVGSDWSIVICSECGYGIGPMQEICAAGSFTKWHTDIQVAFWEKCQQSNERN